MLLSVQIIRSQKILYRNTGIKDNTRDFRKDRNSYKLDLSLNGDYIIELFSFQQPPRRVSRPEAAGLRHLAFEVDNILEATQHLTKHNIEFEPIRIDEYTNKKFTFFSDPDQLPIELYEK